MLIPLGAWILGSALAGAVIGPFVAGTPPGDAKEVGESVGIPATILVAIVVFGRIFLRSGKGLSGLSRYLAIRSLAPFLLGVSICFAGVIGDALGANLGSGFRKIGIPTSPITYGGLIWGLLGLVTGAFHVATKSSSREPAPESQDEGWFCCYGCSAEFCVSSSAALEAITCPRCGYSYADCASLGIVRKEQVFRYREMMAERGIPRRQAYLFAHRVVPYMSISMEVADWYGVLCSTPEARQSLLHSWWKLSAAMAAISGEASKPLRPFDFSRLTAGIVTVDHPRVPGSVVLLEMPSAERLSEAYYLVIFPWRPDDGSELRRCMTLEFTLTLDGQPSTSIGEWAREDRETWVHVNYGAGPPPGDPLVFLEAALAVGPPMAISRYQGNLLQE
ncbi:MAG: hypothetical protein HY720_16695 [Planctomycetes bacterium]|nr:hypothetical protein [Planctomycetota bacterium]